MIDLYTWLKALHVIAIIAWMAGMLYLPRLFVYHAEALLKGETAIIPTFKIMERRLLRFIINPAMILAWLFGLALAQMGDHWGEGWFHGKLLLLLLMQLIHAAFARWRRLLAEDRGPRNPRLYRIANEIPTLLMIGIVILVIVKPF